MSCVQSVCDVGQFSTGYLINGLHDYLILFRRVIHGEFDKNITSCGVDRRMYAMLVEPALEWIVRCLFKNANEVLSYLLWMHLAKYLHIMEDHFMLDLLVQREVLLNIHHG